MNTNIKYKKTTRIIKMMCGLLFSIYSFVFIFFFQDYLLEALHFSLAHGKTSYAPLSTAIILTVLLLLIALAISKIMRIKGRWEALSYAPSFLILSSFADISRNVYIDYSSNKVWIYMVAIAAIIGLLYMMKELLHASEKIYNSTTGIYNLNIFFILLFSIISLTISNTNSTFHNELKIEHMIRCDKYSEALKVGKRCENPSRTMTALRNLTLCKTGEMGNQLFEYPQNYGSQGLFFDNDSTKTLRYTNDSISYMLSINKSFNKTNGIRLNRLCVNDSSKTELKDYYLAQLLLDKELKLFSEALTRLKIDGNKRYYLQAKAMCKILYPETKCTPADSTYIAEYQKYLDEKSEWENPKEEYKEMKYRYGTTYWWYYDYQEVKK